MRKTPSAASVRSPFQPASPCKAPVERTPEELRQRERLFLDIIVDLTGRNTELEQQARAQAEHILELLRLVAELREQLLTAAQLQPSIDDLQRPGGDLEANPRRMPTDASSEYQEPELMNNSSHFVARMRNLLESNFDPEAAQRTIQEESEGDTLKQLPSSANTESLRSIGEPCKEQADHRVPTTPAQPLTPTTPLQFNEKNLQRRNVYVSGASEAATPAEGARTQHGHPAEGARTQHGHPESPKFLSGTIVKRLSTEEKENAGLGFYGDLTTRLERMAARPTPAPKEVSFAPAARLHKYC